MKHFLLAILTLGTVALGYAGNGKVVGKVLGKNDAAPIGYATVALYDCQTHKVVNGCIADSAGQFSISELPAGCYSIECSYVGYKDVKSKTFTIADKAVTDIGSLYLDDSALRLKDVVVTGHKSTYSQTIDRKIFNVGTDISSTSGAVSDLMQNIPSVQVDIDGNVSLRGNDNVLVLIDGKPSILMKGANRGTILQQLPANSIERIEVITNPSAEYKPDGTAGIIYLITKKEKKAGVSGSIVANVGNMKRYNAGLSVGYNTRKFGINANYSFQHNRRDRYTDNRRSLIDKSTSTNTEMAQYTDSKAPSTSHIGTLGMEWNPTANDHFGISGSMNHFTFPRNEDNRLYEKVNGNPTLQYSRYRYDNERQNEGEGAAAYSHNFAKGRKLSIDYTWSFHHELERNNYTNTYTLPADKVTKDNTVIRQKTNENLIRAIYNTPSGEHGKWLLGYEAELDHSDMRYYAEYLQGNNWVKDLTRSNDYIFHEQVHSLYTTYEYSLPTMGFLAGLRGEESIIKSDLITLNQAVKDNYFTCYPTLHTFYRLNPATEFQLNYSLRVNRPEGDDLNPFPEYQDPYNIRTGNPYLKPEKIHSVELGWQWKYRASTLLLTPYYRYTFHKMTEITENMGNGVMKTTKENMSSNSASGVEMIFNSGVGKWLSYNLSSNLYYDKIDASDLGYSSSKGAMAWYMSLNANFYATQNLAFQVNSRYNSSTLTPQGHRKATFIMNLGAKYDIPNRNISIIATVTDLLDTYKNIVEINTYNIIQRVERRRNPRTFYIGATYRFGNGKAKKQTSEIHYDENQ